MTAEAFILLRDKAMSRRDKTALALLSMLAVLPFWGLIEAYYDVPVDGGAFHCPTVVTLHDLYPYDIPANFGFPKVLFNRGILRQCLAAVDAIACVSESTLRQLGIHIPVLILQKAVTIYNCVEPGPPVAAHSPLPVGHGEFLLCVAQHRRNKNVLLALWIFERLRLYGEIDSAALLVIIGNEGPETASIRRFIRTSGLIHNVVLLQGVTDAELEWCYQNCACYWHRLSSRASGCRWLKPCCITATLYVPKYLPSAKSAAPTVTTCRCSLQPGIPWTPSSSRPGPHEKVAGIAKLRPVNFPLRV